MGSAYERRRYIVMSSLIGWAHTKMITVDEHDGTTADPNLWGALWGIAQGTID